MADIFERKETKYILSDDRYAALVSSLSEYMTVDEFGKETVRNVYFDNDFDTVIARSVSGPPYKEKLRLRSYGKPGPDDDVYFELKKKYGGIVYKRRITLPYKEATEYIRSGTLPEGACRIFREIDYFIKYYAARPKLYLAYDRVAMYCKTDKSLRMTIDDNIRYRVTDPDLGRDDGCRKLYGTHFYILEIKCGVAYPFWLVRLLRENNIMPASFSKFGRIYEYLHGGRAEVF